MRIEAIARLLPVVVGLEGGLYRVVFNTMGQQSISGSPDERAQPTRAYRSELRQRQAAETRQRVVAAAAELFASLGYARTTLAKVAAAADVSIETVQANGPKAALMIAAVEFAAFGVIGDTSILDLDLGRRFIAITDRDEAIDFIVAEQTAVHERSAATSRALYGAAASDPALDQYLGELLAGVGRQVRRILEVCSERGWLRHDIAFDEVVETAVVIASMETYVRLVHHGGWTVDAYRTWFRRMLQEVIFTGTPGSGA
jgi:AcrR family transcriptional regulator